jgi:hypothetical protein
LHDGQQRSAGAQHCPNPSQHSVRIHVFEQEAGKHEFNGCKGNLVPLNIANQQLEPWYPMSEPSSRVRNVIGIEIHANHAFRHFARNSIKSIASRAPKNRD